ncbi:hypothetical protein LMG27177_06275 [Paraburkholderia fynbosensis]|uniref:Uncharacterized protein n=1 Tax=Paraburkholderia fynbosensis TaxID=1200993 RepID=A0A6J5GVW2_9BURK|nr:hypothetical protein LMG27177_06275 [Paraburkholderia fynbosensis]
MLAIHCAIDAFMPFSTETEAIESEPMLAVSFHLDLIELTGLILAIDRSGSARKARR